MMFLMNKQNFQQKINELVVDPTKQICVIVRNFNCHDFPSLVDVDEDRRPEGPDEKSSTRSSFPFIKEIDLRYNAKNLEDVIRMRYVSSVNLVSCDKLVDISPLRDVPEVSIFECSNVRDFRILGKQRKLRIDMCEHLVDVNSFANIIELSVSGCPLLTNISPLNNIPILSISDCPLIRDLAPLLGNHKSLTIDNCSYELEGYEILRSIPIVSLVCCNISDVTVLREARSVTLRRCDDLIDVSPLSKVNRITLAICPKVDVSSLVHVPELIISKVPSITNAHLLNNRSLTVEFVDLGSSNLLVASNLRHMTISYFPDLDLGILRNLTRFANLQTLSMVSVWKAFSTEGLGDIPYIYLKECSKVKDISGLGRNREVQLFNCPLIRDVSSLKNVPIVTISQCDGIKDYSCLFNVPRLKIVTI